MKARFPVRMAVAAALAVPSFALAQAPSTASGQPYPSRTGIDIVHVVYKGLTPAFNDVVAGQVPIIISGVVTALPFHQAGRLRILATTAAKRTPSTPDIPTMAEAGVPGFDYDSWTGFLVPTGTPADAISKLNAEVVRITRLPTTSQRLPGFEWIGSTPQAFADHIKANIAKIGKVVREAGIKAE